MNVLVANAGSSGIKLRVLSADDGVLAAMDLDEQGGDGARDAVSQLLETAPAVEAVGHRFVHGGERLRESVVVDAAVLAELGRVRELAPLHTDQALEFVSACSAALDVPQVACFDTAFHVTIPPAARRYPLPADWVERLGLQRYGFHGLSHYWAAQRAADLLDSSAADVRLVSCHLGSGASLAAIERGRSVDTTMGFTPNEGLMMSTRSGSVDPGMLMWIQRELGLGAEAMDYALEHESGLLAMAGTSDMRAVEAAGDARSRAALDVYVHRLRAGVAAMAAAMGGLDAVAFTGGVGEGSAHIRAEACAGLGFLGLVVDAAANRAVGDADADVSGPGATARTLVIHSREDVVIARATRALLA